MRVGRSILEDGKRREKCKTTHSRSNKQTNKNKVELGLECPLISTCLPRHIPVCTAHTCTRTYMHIHVNTYVDIYHAIHTHKHSWYHSFSILFCLYKSKFCWIYTLVSHFGINCSEKRKSKTKLKYAIWNQVPVISAPECGGRRRVRLGYTYKNCTIQWSFSMFVDLCHYAKTYSRPPNKTMDPTVVHFQFVLSPCLPLPGPC